MAKPHSQATVTVPYSHYQSLLDKIERLSDGVNKREYAIERIRLLIQAFVDNHKKDLRKTIESFNEGRHGARVIIGENDNVKIEIKKE